MSSFEGKTVLITGSARGCGNALAVAAIDIPDDMWAVNVYAPTAS